MIAAFVLFGEDDKDRMHHHVGLICQHSLCWCTTPKRSPSRDTCNIVDTGALCIFCEGLLIWLTGGPLAVCQIPPLPHHPFSVRLCCLTTNTHSHSFEQASTARVSATHVMRHLFCFGQPSPCNTFIVSIQEATVYPSTLGLTTVVLYHTGSTRHYEQLAEIPKAIILPEPVQQISFC